jgi:hypothetical protein
MGNCLSATNITANKRQKVASDPIDDFDFRTDINLLEERKSFFGNHEYFSPHTSPREIRTRCISEDNENTDETNFELK